MSTWATCNVTCTCKKVDCDCRQNPGAVLPRDAAGRRFLTDMAMRWHKTKEAAEAYATKKVEINPYKKYLIVELHSLVSCVPCVKITPGVTYD